QLLGSFKDLVAGAREVKLFDRVSEFDGLLSEFGAPIDAALEVSEEFVVIRVLESELARDDAEGAAGERNGLAFVGLEELDVFGVSSFADGVDGGRKRTSFVYRGQGFFHGLRHMDSNGGVESLPVFHCGDAMKDVIVGAAGG